MHISQFGGKVVLKGGKRKHPQLEHYNWSLLTLYARALRLILPCPRHPISRHFQQIVLRVQAAAAADCHHTLISEILGFWRMARGFSSVKWDPQWVLVYLTFFSSEA